MFYVLLCLQIECYGMDIMERVRSRTEGRVVIGPGTLYHLLDDFLAVGLPINCPYKIADMAEIMCKDKKAEAGKIHFVLPASIGDVRIVDMTIEQVVGLLA